MITSYLPTLNKPSKKSADWYVRFHQMYYLSQLTGLTLLSYMDSFIEMNSKAIIRYKVFEGCEKLESIGNMSKSTV